MRILHEDLQAPDHLLESGTVAEDSFGEVRIVVLFGFVDQHVDRFEGGVYSWFLALTMFAEELYEFLLKDLFVFLDTFLCILIYYNCFIEFSLEPKVIFTPIKFFSLFNCNHIFNQRDGILSILADIFRNRYNLQTLLLQLSSVDDLQGKVKG